MAQLRVYEQRLQSQDLMMRHLARLTLNNFKDIFLNPARLSVKLGRWYRARVKQERVTFDEN